MPKKRALPPTILDKLALLPPEPGVYLHKDEGGNVLYVGKAINLRNRVRSYFQDSAKHGPRIARLVAKARDLEWIVVGTEVEALVLECNLIKKYRPALQRADAGRQVVSVHHHHRDEEFPRLMFTRRVRKDKARYFGAVHERLRGARHPGAAPQDLSPDPLRQVVERRAGAAALPLLPPGAMLWDRARG